MTRTGEQIVTDFISLIRQTSLADAVEDRIYRQGLRPKDSRDEDAVVSYTTADAGQFQKGVVTLNVYVPDIPYGREGSMVKDSERCEHLEQVCQASVKSLTAAKSNYKFKLRSAVHSIHDDNIGQSIVVAQVEFSYID